MRLLNAAGLGEFRAFWRGKSSRRATAPLASPAGPRNDRATPWPGSRICQALAPPARDRWRGPGGSPWGRQSARVAARAWPQRGLLVEVKPLEPLAGGGVGLSQVGIGGISPVSVACFLLSPKGLRQKAVAMPRRLGFSPKLDPAQGGWRPVVACVGRMGCGMRVRSARAPVKALLKLPTCQAH